MCPAWFFRTVIVFTVSILMILAPRSEAVEHSLTNKPNIIFILSDDEDVSAHVYMPKTRTLLHEQGTTLSNFFVSYSLCCPSRASILTGQYSHNTHIEGNEPPAGGFVKAFQTGLEQQTLAVWLQQAGYHTMLAGKYLNGYGKGGAGAVVSTTYIPPGWDEWYGAMGGAPYHDFNYRINEAGTVVTYGSTAEDYLTDVISRKAVAAIHNAVTDGKPLFLFLSPYTPHLPANYAPRHAELFTDLVLPQPPSFNEADISDKPSMLNSKRLISAKDIDNLTHAYIKRLRSLQAIDDMVEAVVNALTETGQLDNSYIIYTSDNGFHMGEHRQHKGKNMPYEEDIRVPFVVRGPSVATGVNETRFGVNIDIAPTILQMAGIEIPSVVDGRSLYDVLTAGAGSKTIKTADKHPKISMQQMPDTWRNCFLIARGIQLAAQLEPGDEVTSDIAFNGLRCPGYTYVEWSSGESEFYDLNNDPYQLQNIAASLTVDQRALLSVHLHDLARCAGASCRTLEDQALPSPFAGTSLMEAIKPKAAL